MTWYGWCRSDGNLAGVCAAAHATNKLTALSFQRHDRGNHVVRLWYERCQSD
jgi:hypothetical protein